jgi:hypothetical protein
MNNDFNDYVPNVHFEKIAIKNLVSNQEYQRHLSLAHIQKLIENFDLYQINPVKISRRNGLNMVMNGQHTIEGVAGASGSRETPVWCMVYDDLEYEKEADIFANQQKYMKPLNPYEIFMAKIEAGDDAQIIIKSLVESYGLILSNTRMSGGIGALNCLQKLFDKYGYHLLDRVIRLCVITWEGDPLSLSANMMNGVSRLIIAFGDALKDDVFRDRVGIFSARDISRTARERRAGSLGFAEALLMAYNRKSKAGLQWSKLYGRKANEQDDISRESDTSALPPINM